MTYDSFKEKYITEQKNLQETPLDHIIRVDIKESAISIVLYENEALLEGLFFKKRRKPRSFVKELRRKNRLARKFSRTFGKVINSYR